jgi:hypothetical protein
LKPILAQAAAPLKVQALNLAVYLGDQRAGGIDGVHVARLGGSNHRG